MTQRSCARRHPGLTWGAVLVVAAALAVTGFSVKSPTKSWAVAASSTLFAEGGSFELPVITALQNSAGGTGAIAPLVPGYFNANVDQGRDDFVSGTADYAVSEMPLTTAQAATAAQGKRSFAYVPFAASAIAIGAIVECSNDQVLKPTTLCPNLQLTVPLLAEILTQHVTSWNDPQFAHVSAGNPVLATDVSANIHPVNQVEPSAVNQDLAALFENDPTDNQAAKQTWESFLHSKLITDYTPSELWPTGGGLTGGDRAVADSLIPVNETTNPPIPQPNPAFWGEGDLAGLPTDWLGAPRNIPTVAVQNVAGQYVSPTVPAITAAEQDATMDATTNLVTYHNNTNNAAAYPIPVMNYLIVPTSGLSAAKATALAAFIRYVLGSGGQTVLQSLGDAPVTPAMASAGLHVADVVAAEATTTTTTTSTTGGSTTSTTKAGAPGSATAAAVPTGDTSGSSPGTGSSSTPGTSGNTGAGTSAGPSASTSSGPTLAYTGGAPWIVAVAGGVLLVAGEAARRPLRRRLRQRGSVP